jgi:hypothetical protein
MQRALGCVLGVSTTPTIVVYFAGAVGTASRTAHIHTYRTIFLSRLALSFFMRLAEAEGSRATKQHVVVGGHMSLLRLQAVGSLP